MESGLETKAKAVLVLLAEGFEEIEAVAPVDLLRRAGLSCTVAALDEPLLVTGRNGIRLRADVLLRDLDDPTFDGIFLPGGPGTKRLRDDPRVAALVRSHAARGQIVSAICAAPTVLAAAGLLEDRRYTAHESVRAELPRLVEDEAVIIDGNLVTSRGAGTALELGLALVSLIAGPEVADRVAAAIHFHPR